MSGKNILLVKTTEALKNLTSSLSECSAALNIQRINAGQKDADWQAKLAEAQTKIEMLTQSSQNAIANINELSAKIDKVLN